jgi:hypothetical protein
MKPKLDRADDGPEISLISFFRALPEGAEVLRVSDVRRISRHLLIRNEVLDILNPGHKKFVDVVKLLRLLNKHKIELTPSREWKGVTCARDCALHADFI